MMPRAKLALLYGVMGLIGGSFALGNEPQVSTSHSQHAAPDPNEDTSSEAPHVPPDPPQHPIGDMPYPQMAALMQMDDTARTGMVLFDQLEWRNTTEGNALAWDAEGWYGGDTNKVWLRSEGERVAGTTQNARADLLWDHTFARWWSVQAGGRQDFGAGPGRTWAAIGVQGLAPYWFNTEATFYVGEQGRTAVRLKSEYELLFTQRLILQPEAETNLYGKPDPARQLGSGLSDLEIGLRLRYEVRREFAPYIGVVWSRQFGGTADRMRASGGNPSDVQFVAGVRAWF
jgi:copper resistance protein B